MSSKVSETIESETCIVPTDEEVERGLDGTLVCRESFPLPELGPKLDTLRRDLYSGRGFGCVRGLNTAEYPVEDLTILQLGIQAHIANRYGRQDKKGNMMGTSPSEVVVSVADNDKCT